MPNWFAPNTDWLSIKLTCKRSLLWCRCFAAVGKTLDFRFQDWKVLFWVWFRWCNCNIRADELGLNTRLWYRYFLVEFVLCGFLFRQLRLHFDRLPKRNVLCQPALWWLWKHIYRALLWRRERVFFCFSYCKISEYYFLFNVAFYCLPIFAENKNF